MGYNITLGLMRYVVVLIAFGVIGSCFQAHRRTSSVRPFVARIITGSFSGAITMLVVYKLGMEADPPELHWGVATVLGAIIEKKDGNNVIERFILALGNGVR